jgi:hypothetical protein
MKPEPFMEHESVSAKSKILWQNDEAGRKKKLTAFNVV